MMRLRPVGGCLQAGGTDLRAPSCDRPGGESWYPVCVKYLTFTLVFPEPPRSGLLSFGIELPIGISFFTFQALSYVLDVHPPEGRFCPEGVGFTSPFSPNSSPGPIVKYETVAQQIDHRKEIWADFSAGCSRFIVGLGKKVLLSNQLAVVADRAFVQGDCLSASFAGWAPCATPPQIYYDFSAFSDMAIMALARCSASTS